MRRLRFETVTLDEAQTIRVGERLGGALRDGAALGLIGALGAGKTRLTQGIARGAGYAGRVRSPSFALMHVYRGRLEIRHLDLYRLDDLDAGTAGEWEEAIDAGGISIVEWADRIPDLLPAEAIRIFIEAEGASRRRIRMEFPVPPACLDHWRLR